MLLLWRGVWEGLCRGCGVEFRKGRYVHLYNCIVGRFRGGVIFRNVGDGESRESVF